MPGSEWDAAIAEALRSADIILLLISKSFAASEYISKYEVPAAMESHGLGRSRVVPILLEDVPGWHQAEFAKLQFLPTGARPISTWNPGRSSLLVAYGNASGCAHIEIVFSARIWSNVRAAAG